MRKLLLPLVLLIWSGAVAGAQEAGSPAALEAARQLVQVMSPDMTTKLTQAMTQQVWPTIENQLGRNLDADTIADMRKAFERVIINYVDDMMKEAAPLYAKYLTAQELTDITNFYRTPTGQKSLDVMPQVMGEFYGLMVPRMATLDHEIDDAMQGVLKAHGKK